MEGLTFDIIAAFKQYPIELFIGGAARRYRRAKIKTAGGVRLEPASQKRVTPFMGDRNDSDLVPTR